MASKAKTERDFYPAVKDWLEKELRQRFQNVYLEITANRTFTKAIKEQIPSGREIIFNFLREAAPDITGFIKGQFQSEFIVVEVKNEVIKLDDIYQTKKYADLFDAQYALLVSPEEIPEELIRLSRSVPNLLNLSHYLKRFVLVRLEVESGNTVWFEKNPFA
jgi:hypothetical protein